MPAPTNAVPWPPAQCERNTTCVGWGGAELVPRCPRALVPRSRAPLSLAVWARGRGPGPGRGRGPRRGLGPGWADGQGQAGRCAGCVLPALAVRLCEQRLQHLCELHLLHLRRLRTMIELTVG